MTSQFVSCPDCHTLVLDTVEERREHRAADRQDRQVVEALRRGLRAAEDAAKTAAQAVRDLQRDLEGLDGRVRDVTDAPEPELVVVNEWPEDELDELDDEDDVQESQYAGEDLGALDDDEDESHTAPTAVDYFTSRPS